jgi:hypothetical protein
MKVLFTRSASRSGQFMTTTERVIVDGRALIGWHHLPAPAQTRIREALARLAERPRDQWAEEEVEPWRPEEDLFVLHTQVGADHLLVFFRPEEGRIRLLDMVLKETIDRYFTPRNGA